MKVLSKIYAFFASYAFAILLLFFMFWLTLFGTLAQRSLSLFEVQKRYFESNVVVEHFRGVPIPLPGVKLLLGLLCVNLILGGMIRIRKKGATVGIIIAHCGILLMLVAGLVEYLFSTKGYMKLEEGQTAEEYISYFEWEITVNEEGSTRELVIPGEHFVGLKEGQSATFKSDELPFDLVVDQVAKNATVVPANRRLASDTLVIGDYCLRRLPLNKEAEADSLACRVTLHGRDGSEEPVLLWGNQAIPYTTTRDGKRWLIDVHRRRWTVPFEIELADFRKIDYPGTTMAKSFESDVVKREGGVAETINISMNNPLRHHGYTFFQSNWGPQNGEAVPPYSVFSVVRNPADAWPLYACYIIAVGLSLHFMRKLWLYVQAQARSRAQC